MRGVTCWTVGLRKGLLFRAAVGGHRQHEPAQRGYATARLPLGHQFLFQCAFLLPPFVQGNLAPFWLPTLGWIGLRSRAMSQDCPVNSVATGQAELAPGRATGHKTSVIRNAQYHCRSSTHTPAYAPPYTSLCTLTDISVHSPIHACKLTPCTHPIHSAVHTCANAPTHISVRTPLHTSKHPPPHTHLCSTSGLWARAPAITVMRTRSHFFSVRSAGSCLSSAIFGEISGPYRGGTCAHTPEPSLVRLSADLRRCAMNSASRSSRTRLWGSDC